MVIRVLETNSPVDSSRSSSLGSGSGETVWARSMSSSVVSPMADYHGDDLGALPPGVGDAAGDVDDAVGVGQRAAAVFLDD